MYQTPRQRSNFKLQLAENDRIAGRMITSWAPVKVFALQSHLLRVEPTRRIYFRPKNKLPLRRISPYIAHIKDYSYTTYGLTFKSSWELN